MALGNKNMLDRKKRQKNKAAGTRFELKVRKDLESKGWIVSKWMNNLSWFVKDVQGKTEDYEMHSAKHKFRGPGIPMAIGTGFPDFIALKTIPYRLSNYRYVYEVIGVEAKSNGYLTAVEREKCQWLLDNEIFSKILIAKKGIKRGEIKYNEF